VISVRKPRKSVSSAFKKVRKPMAPPTRVEPDPTKYRRPAEAERLRRELKK